MAKTKNTFIELMDQDTSKSKYKNTKIYKGVNIKVLTEEGLSSGAIENEDGNKLSFEIPDTFPIYKIKYNNISNPTGGTLTFNITDPITGLTSIITTTNVDSIDELYTEIVSVTSIISDDVKIISRGSFIYIICLNNYLSIYNSSGGLSEVTNVPYIDSQSDLKIIGWLTLRDEIVLFTTNETSETPSSAGQFWKFKYDPITKEIDGLSNGKLSLYDHYIYNGYLNFSTYWHIGTEALGHYENSKVARGYWTDEYNQLRSANMLDPDLFSTDPSQFDIVEGVTHVIPVVNSVRNGGNIPYGACVQYCYRMYTDGGRLSTISPISNPINLAEYDPLDLSIGNRNHESPGELGSAGANKVIRYTLNNLDSSFSYIEHIAIVTSDTGGTDIYKFAEEEIPADGNLTVTHSDKLLNIPLTPLELSTLTRTFTKCKTITIKDKRLIAANLSTTSIELDDYDSRAYRFNSSRIAKLLDNEISTINLDDTFSNVDYTIVPEDFDCINPYNKADIPSNTNRYKYQSDGVTLGGEGLNIKYKIINKEIPIRSRISGLSGGLPSNGEYDIFTIGRVNDAPIYNNSNFKTLNDENRIHQSSRQNFKSPLICGAYTGYARGEVYRFGIVFYDKQGNPLNVKWIGDIRLPEAYEDSGTNGITKHNVLSGGWININGKYSNDAPIIGKSLGVEFEVNIEPIKNLISGYEIVRVKRDESNKTRLGTGLLTHFTNQFGTSLRDAGGIPLPSLIDSYTNVGVAGNVGQIWGLPFEPSVTSDTNSLKTALIISPTSLLRNQTSYTYKSGLDKIRTIGFYKDLRGTETSPTGATNYETGGFMAINSSLSNKSQAYNLILGFEWYPATSSTAEVKDITQEDVFSGESYLRNFKYSASLSFPGDTFINMSGSFDSSPIRFPAGIGDDKQIMDIDSIFSYYTPTQIADARQGFITNPPLPSNVGNISADTWWREVSYERSLLNQYGGNTNEARSRNAYISTGSYKPIYEDSNDININTVFGGDVYITQFNYQYLSFNEGNSIVPQSAAKKHMGISFPCETPINTEYQVEGCYGDKTTRDALSGVNTILLNGKKNYVVPFHYAKQNEVKAIFYPAGFIDRDIVEHPHRIWASERKLDGELLDSWKIWLPNNYTEVDGQYGQINKITTARDIFHFYQDTAFGAASINDRAVMNDEDGVSFTLGSGGILDDYGYISRNTGTRQKFSVVPTGMSIHHYDDILNKWVRYSDGPKPVSDIEGLHSTFRKLNGQFLKSDRTLLGKGIHGMFDKVRNRVHMTFLDAKDDVDYTIIYNENLQGFESFSDCIPSMYLESHGKLLAINPELTKGYVQYEGEKNNFFGTVYPSVIELILNPAQDMTAIFDNIEYKGEISINDIDQSNLTLDSLQVINDHQDTGVISLVPDANIKRRFRSWRTTFPRDITSPNQDARMRDYFVKLILTHTPNSNERMVLHDIQYEFRITPH